VHDPRRSDQQQGGVMMSTLQPAFIKKIIVERIEAATQGGAPPEPRSGKIAIHDATLGIWEKGVNEDEMRSKVLGPTIRFLRSIGWKVGDDPQTKKHYPTLNQNHRYGRKGDLETAIRLCGRHLEIVLFQNVANVTNINGGRYDFDKIQKMPYLLRVQAVWTMAALSVFLAQRHGYSLSMDVKLPVGAGWLTAMQSIEAEYASSYREPCHLRSDWSSSGLYNRNSGDGQILEQGQTVWLKPDYGPLKRFWIKGQAFHRFNNMWWVVAGQYQMHHCSAHELRTTSPGSERGVNHRQRRESLEKKLSKAWSSGHFERAARLRKLLFGDQPLFRIWSDKKDAWYACQAMGYAVSPERIGLFTREEAEAQIRGIDYLKMVAV
jgi:hypothetical protein